MSFTVGKRSFSPVKQPSFAGKASLTPGKRALNEGKRAFSQGKRALFQLKRALWSYLAFFGPLGPFQGVEGFAKAA